MLSLLKKLFSPKNPVDFKSLLANGAVIVDVRNPGEFAQGHIRGAINIPLGQLTGKISSLKNKTVITCCQSGIRSSAAKSSLIKAGIECYNGGGWYSLQNKIA